MSRKGPSKIRKILPDMTYQSLTVSKIINYAMLNGKKEVAQKQIYQALALIKKAKPKVDVLDTLEQALDNIKPKVEIRPRRIGGSVYQVPSPLRSHRQTSLAIRWLVRFARQRPNQQYHSFAQKLSAELLDALTNQGGAVNKRLEIERTAEANKAFAHLRW